MLRKAVVLLSGGLDSTTTLAIARSQGFDAHALTFRYGQRHAAEIEAARRIAAADGRGAARRRRHRPADVRRLRAHRRHRRPKDRAPEEMTADIPVTYVPARNTIFLSFALAWAEVLEARRHLHRRQRARLQRLSRLPAGVHRGVRAMANLATRAGVEGRARLAIHTPLIDLTKARDHPTRPGARRRLRADQLSCYDPTPSGEACGHCDACLLRLTGFAENGAARSDRVRATPRSPCDLRSEGDLLHAPGRGRERRAAGGVLPLRRLQPVDGTRGRIGRPPSASSATPISSASMARAAAGSRRLTTWRASVGGHLAGRAPAARRLVVCTGGEPLLQLDDALDRRAARARLRDRGRDQRHAPSRRAGSTGSASARRPEPSWCSAAATS